MKILINSRAYIGEQYRDKIGELAKFKDVEIFLVVPHKFLNKDFEGKISNKYDTIIKKLYLQNSYHIAFYSGVKNIIKSIKPDIVHIEDEPFNLSTFQWVKAAKKIGSKIIFFTWQNIKKVYPPPFSLFNRYILKNSDYAIVGNLDGAGILKQFGYNKPISIIPQNGVNGNIFSPSKIKPHKSKIFRIIYIGRLVKEKGIGTLIDAMKILNKKFCLDIIGNGSYKKEMVTKIKKLKLDNIKIIGGIPSYNVPKYIKRSSALILPSITTKRWKEQFGRVLIEAMACEVPVIGSNSGEIPNVIGDCGLIFKEGDSNDLARKIELIYKNKSLATKLGKIGRKRVVKNFTNRIIAKRTYDIYKKLMQVD